MTEAAAAPVILLPDAGPLIALAYAKALPLLLKPGWRVQIVDMVLHEVTRNNTPTSEAIAAWVDANRIGQISTNIYRHSQSTARKNNFGELAVQEAMCALALQDPAPIGIFLFKDHKIARNGFILPEHCKKISTRAYLIYLEQKGWIESAAAIEREAILAGREFSQLRFPSG